MDTVHKDIELIMTASSPDQDSPKHILNALNNDCIQEMFRRLENIEDFLSVAETCKKFQENARQCFPKTYKVFYATYAKNNFPISNKLLSINRLQSFLCIFGDFIETIAWGNHWERCNLECPYTIHTHYFRVRKGAKEDREYDNNNLLSMADHCGKTVIELQVMFRFIDFNIMHKFQALEKLEIYRCASIYVKLSDPELFPNLKILKMNDLLAGNVEWLEQTFPKLIEADLISVKGLNENTLIEFIKRNPQLQCLSVYNTYISSSFWHSFDNLSSSKLRWLDVQNPWFFKDEIKRLSKCFSNLTYINLESLVFDKQFINLLVENNVPIETLSMKHCDTDCVEIIRKLKHIKAIEISSSTKGDLKKLCNTLPTLKELKIWMSGLNEMEILDALKYGKNLSMLSVGICGHFTIDSNFFHNLLNINKNRVKLELFGYKLTLLVDNSILNHNANWLKIRQGNCSQFAMDGSERKSLEYLPTRSICQLGWQK